MWSLALLWNNERQKIPTPIRAHRIRARGQKTKENGAILTVLPNRHFMYTYGVGSRSAKHIGHSGWNGSSQGIRLLRTAPPYIRNSVTKTATVLISAKIANKGCMNKSIYRRSWMKWFSTEIRWVEFKEDHADAIRAHLVVRRRMHDPFPAIHCA